MAKPVSADWCLLKRIAKYLIGSPRAVWRYYWQAAPSRTDAYVDSDWAGCKHTARSTSGGIMMHGLHAVKSWSATQAVVALSSGEAELYALTRGAAQTLARQALCKDLGSNLEMRIHTDANATLGIVRREGLGKLRHVKVQFLWMQDRLKDGDFEAVKVKGTENAGDLLTKPLTWSEIQAHCDRVGVNISTGRAGIAPQLASINARIGLNYKADNWGRGSALYGLQQRFCHYVLSCSWGLTNPYCLYALRGELLVSPCLDSLLMPPKR